MNPYDVLGVRPGASADEVRAAWRRKVLTAHPDRGGDEAAFAEALEAYRALGTIRDKLPGGGPARGVTQGVSVEVGERQAAIDLDVVVEYGVPIVDVANAVRDNVSSRVERMTGLEVTEVNVTVDDIYLESEEEEPPAPERVQ